jgi:iron complex outermembrane receptor protein
MSHQHRLPVLVSFSAAAAIASAVAHAQGSGAGQEQGGLSEIVVQATRAGETNLQETPISVTAINSEQIDRVAVAGDISDIASTVPNFSAARITAFNAASFAMRGVGQTDIIVYLDSPVGVTVDDFVMPSVQTQLLDTFDIAAVEVLRGPQGTLFGKNTTGGAVTIRTKRPSLTDFSGEARVLGGNFGTLQGQLALDVPLVNDKFGLRFVGSYTQSDGYYKNGAAFSVPFPGGPSGRGNGADAGGEDVFSGRLKGLWQVTDNLSALFQFELVRDRSDSVPSYNDTPDEGNCSPNCLFVWNVFGLTRDPGDPLDRMATTNRNDSLLNIGRGQIIDVEGGYANVDWDLGNFTLFSVTGFRHQESRLPNTYTGEVGPVSLFDASRDDIRNTFQQEVRIASRLDGPVNFVAGAFYQRNDARFCVMQVLGFLDLFGVPIQAGGLPASYTGTFNNTPSILCNRQDADTWAGFVDGTWRVSDRFSLGAGVRYTREEKFWAGRNQRAIQILTGTFNPSFTWRELGDTLNAADFARFPDGVLTNEESWSEPTWRVTGSYKLTDDVFGYATVSRGFKSGGYNDQTGTSPFNIPILPIQTEPYDPEFATNYEIGLKMELFNRRLRLNPTVFYVEYEDAQRAVVQVLPTTPPFQETRFVNAAELTVKGFELEAQAALTDALQARLAFGYQDAEYDRFNATTLVNIGGVPTPRVIDLSGRDVPRTPETSGSLELIYTASLGAGELQLSGQYVHEDENVFYYADPTAFPTLTPAQIDRFNTVLDAKNLLHASITYRSPDDRWFLTAFGRNLTDERYRIASQVVANLWTHTQWGAPRTYGLQVGYNFGERE